MSKSAAPISERLSDLASAWLIFSVLVGIVSGFVACCAAYVAPAVGIGYLLMKVFGL